MCKKAAGIDIDFVIPLPGASWILHAFSKRRFSQIFRIRRRKEIILDIPKKMYHTRFSCIPR